MLREPVYLSVQIYHETSLLTKVLETEAEALCLPGTDMLWPRLYPNPEIHHFLLNSTMSFYMESAK